MTVIDADAHVEESPAMFGFLEKEYHPRRPLPLGFDRDTVYGPHNAVWLIDGKVYPKLQGRGGVIFRTPTLMDSARQKRESIPAQELTDVAARLRDLDRVGIDKQVVYPSLFLAVTTDDLKLEAALLRAYNSFMADACSKSGGRIMFAALAPIRDVEESRRELKRARGLGAVSVMLHGMAWDKCLGDERLFPFYGEAEKLGIPVCVHLGWGCPAMTEIFDARTNFYSAILPVLMAFHNLMISEVPAVFPKLKLAFLETGSEWVPYLVRQVRTGNLGGKSVTRDPSKYFREGRIFIGCEADEEISQVVNCIGEDALVAASDYPHADPSREEEMVKAFMEREDLPLRVKEKILSANPQRLYGL